jgi:coenzyme PQQ precursor peptide PqqA
VKPKKCASFNGPQEKKGRRPMIWTRPVLREICIGMEINGYLAARM